MVALGLDDEACLRHGLTRTMSRELTSVGILTSLVMAGLTPA